MKELTDEAYDDLKAACDGYLDHLRRKDSKEDDVLFEHYVFDAGMQAIYGRGVWPGVTHLEDLRQADLDLTSKTFRGMIATCHRNCRRFAATTSGTLKAMYKMAVLVRALKRKSRKKR